MIPDNRLMHPRYMRGRRIHHGLVGLVFVGVGALLCGDDWKDRRVWVNALWRDRQVVGR